MSGECDKCGEHCTECKCEEIKHHNLQKWEDDLNLETEAILKSLQMYFPEIKKGKK